MHWNTNFYAVLLLTSNYVCLCYRKKKRIIFYFQSSTNFHTKHQNFRLCLLGMSRLWSATFEQNIALEYISSTTIKSSNIATDNRLKWCTEKAVLVSLLFMNGNGLCEWQPLLFTFLVILTSGLCSPIVCNNYIPSKWMNHVFYSVRLICGLRATI